MAAAAAAPPAVEEVRRRLRGRERRRRRGQNQGGVAMVAAGVASLGRTALSSRTMGYTMFRPRPRSGKGRGGRDGDCDFAGPFESPGCGEGPFPRSIGWEKTRGPSFLDLVSNACPIFPLIRTYNSCTGVSLTSVPSGAVFPFASRKMRGGQKGTIKRLARRGKIRDEEIGHGRQRRRVRSDQIRSDQLIGNSFSAYSSRFSSAGMRAGRSRGARSLAAEALFGHQGLSVRRSVCCKYDKI